MELPQPPGLCSPERLLQVPEPSSFWSQFVCGFPPLICRKKRSSPALFPSFPEGHTPFVTITKPCKRALSSYTLDFFLRGNFVISRVWREAASPQLRPPALKRF